MKNYIPPEIIKMRRRLTIINFLTLLIMIETLFIISKLYECK